MEGVGRGGAMLRTVCRVHDPGKEVANREAQTVDLRQEERSGWPVHLAALAPVLGKASR